MKAKNPIDFTYFEGAKTGRVSYKIKPVAVIINDLHFSLNTLTLAGTALQQAVNKAETLDIPLILAGDTHDTKANLRGECVNALVKIFASFRCVTYLMIGNHDRINEKSYDHALEFLSPYCNIVNNVQWLPDSDICLIPYQYDPEHLRFLLKRQGKRPPVYIMHQGIAGSNSGEYIQDKSAIKPEDVAGMRVISGHYHTRQDIVLPDGGLWSYTGNPYTLNFAEAGDGPKGFHVLYDDGSLEFIPTNLRKHAILELAAYDLSIIEGSPVSSWQPEDLVWVKVHGTKEQLAKHSKSSIATELGRHDFRLDLIPTASNEQKRPVAALSQQELLDSLIDQQNASDELKTRLKQTWRGM